MLSFDGVDRKVNNALSKGLGTAGKRGGKDFGKQFAGATEVELKKLGDAYGKLADRQKDASGKMRAEEAKLEDLRKRGITSGARYVAQHERAEKAKRDEARATKTATDALKEYEAAQKSASNAGDNVGKGLVGKLKGIAGATRSAGGEAASGFVEGFGGPIASLGTKAGPIGLALAAAAGLGLAFGGLLATNIAAGMEREQQRDLIQAKFGLDDRTMATVATAAGKAYTQNFGESVQGNIEAAAAAIQNGLLPKDATAQQTQAAVSQLDTVAKVLGVDIPEAARSAGQLMRTGYAKDFNQAADLIVAGAHSGLNISQDWLDTVNEYSTQFRKLGLSGPEAMGLLSQAVKAGARDTDVAADALKEFSIRSVDGSKTTKQAFKDLGLNAHAMKEAFAQGGQTAHDAFGQVVTALKNVNDPAKKAQISVSLFGTQAEDLGGALNAFDLSTATQQLGEVGGAAQKAADIIGGNTESAVDTARRSVEVAVDGMQDSLVKVFGPSVEQFAKFFTDHQPEITSFFAIIGQIGASTASGVIRAFGEMTKVIGWGVQNLGDVIGWVAQGLGKLLNQLGPVVGYLDKDAGEAFKNAGKAIEGFGNDAHSWGEGLDKVADGAFKMAGDIDKLSAQMSKASTESTDSQKALKGHQDQLDKSKDSTKKLGDTVDGLGKSLNDLPKKTDVQINLQQAGGVPAGGGATHWWGNKTAAVGGASGSRQWLEQSLTAAGIPADQVQGLLALNKVEGGESDPKSILGFTEAQAVELGGQAGPQGHLNAFLNHQWKSQRTLGLYENGRPPGTDESGRVTDAGRFLTFLRQMVGQEGVKSDWEGNAQPAAADYQSRLQVALGSGGPSSPQTSAPTSAYPGDEALLAAIGPGRYSQDASRDLLKGLSDCSSSVGDLVTILDTGGTNGQKLTTGNAPEWLAQHGFVQGMGGAGDFRVGFNTGHMQATLPGGTPWNWGSDAAAARGGVGGTGADDPSLTSHWYRPGGGGGGVMPVSDPTRNPNLINAFGPGYKSGIGTPGYNEYGEAGYYRTDPKALRQAQQQVEDAQERVKQAEEAVADAKAKAAELDEDSTEEERKTALRQLENAQTEAKRARREAQDARDDAEETKKGKFTAAQKADKTKADSNGRLGGLGDIAASFFKDTLGLGDLFPDPSQLGIVKIAEALLGIKYTPQGKGMPWQSGYANGDGTPWSGSPDMGLGDYAQVGGASSAPFGLPNIPVPPAPADQNSAAPELGPGTPGGPSVVINAGNTFNGTVGIGPDEIEKKRQMSVARAIPRIPQGS